jgi:hypothetical protein
MMSTGLAAFVVFISQQDALSILIYFFVRELLEELCI